jgi:hypothetical protein
MRREMPRTLSVSRVTVPAEAQAEYLETVRQLAELSGPRGRRLWLFRLPGCQDVFLECSESRSRDLHRGVGPQGDDERRLEERLRELASYPPDAGELWEEVAL